MLIRTLNEKGRNLFKDMVDTLLRERPETKAIFSPKPRPMHILKSEEYTEKFAWDIEIDDEPEEFMNRYDLGISLSSKFNDKAVPRQEIVNNAGVWNWLGLYWIYQTAFNNKGMLEMPATGTSTHVRYYFTGERLETYRHLIFSAWNLVDQFGHHALIFLQSRNMRVHGEISEQLGSNHRATKGVIETAYRLWWDEKNGKPKAASASKGAGSPRRLAKILRQLDLTYDLSSISANELIPLLPKEFEVFLPNSSSTGSSGSIGPPRRPFEKAIGRGHY